MRELPTGTVTLLFCDIEGSTHLLQQVGNRYASLLMESRHLLRTAFQQWNGHEVDTQGDAFFVAFARTTDAISAAVDAQRALARHSWPEGTMVRVRMGLHTGEPSLISEGYVGLDVHRAARIMAAGHGGQVLLSQATCMLVEHDLPDAVSLRDLEEHRLKDLQGPQRLFQLVIADLPADFPPLKTLNAHPNNLPIQPTPFIGREQELTVVRDLLGREEVRLVTLSGPGGTGKTRLGLQVAAELSERFVNGVFFVDLAPISDPDLVLSTIAQTLGIREMVGQSLLERLSEELQPKQVLLLLDNFEQVVSAALVVADLLVVCPQLKVLVTSRVVLHVRAEYEFAVPPLALPDPTHLRDLTALSQYEAVALFLQRAQAVKPDFQMTTANAPAVAEICIRLDGLPLAIELAAARIKLLPPPALLARLEHRLQVLTSGARDVPVRQQTLRNTIAWSYHLLDAAEQRLFRQLSVFVGGCQLSAAESVCTALSDGDGAGPVLDGVASLIDKSLLQPTAQEEAEPRLVMLETIREYGLECLMTSGEEEITRHAHTVYYLALAEKAEPKLFGGEQGVWLERLEREHDNLRAALHWSAEHGEAEIALRLGGALCGCWSVRGRLSEGRYWMKRALTGSKEVVASVRAKALQGAGLLALSQHDHDQGEILCGESLALYRELGDTRGMAISLNLLGHVAWVRHNYAAAQSLTEEALTFFNAVRDKGGIAWSLSALANVAIAQGEYTRARELSEESLALYRESGDKASIADALHHLARVVFCQGEYATVRSLVEESLAILREVDDKEGIGKSLCLLGQLVLHQRDAATARLLIEESLTVCREAGYRRGTAESLFFLANIAAFQGDYAAASGLYEESLGIFREVDEKWFVVSCLEGLGTAIAAQGQPAWAARLWGTAESLRDGTDLPIPFVGEASDPLLLLPVEHDRYEQAMAVARTQLGEEAFTAAWAEGRTMSLKQALVAQGLVIMPQQLATGPAPAPPAKSPRYLAGLTEREVEVLRLVTQGLTNAQIAEQLIVSPHTVHTHVRSIHSKLGVTSRSAVTRYAFEHHLA
jgi:predicted ATPase/class 3 adenylate cyclase/DNA-binding CsgD family transcriptional regulator